MDHQRDGEWLTAPAAAEILGITVKELRLLIHQGVIAGYRFTRGGRVRLRASEVRELAARRSASG